MKYCNQCNLLLSENSLYCAQCGSEAQEKLSAALKEQSNIVTFAQYLRSNNSLLHNQTGLHNLLEETFPGDTLRHRCLEELLEKFGDELIQCREVDEKVSQELAQKALRQCPCFESAARQAFLTLAFALGKCSLTDYTKWHQAAELRPDFSSEAANSFFLSLSTSHYQPGSKLIMGTYPQHSGTMPEPIAWIVLAREENSLLVMSEQCLDAKPYHNENEEITWEKCSLRAWLNSEFLSTAFSEEEQAAIQLSNVRTLDNPEESSSQSADTQDFLYILSVDEADKYLASEGERYEKDDGYEYKYPKHVIAQATSFAYKNGAMAETTHNCNYWLRTPGYTPDKAVYIQDTGILYMVGCDVSCKGIGVRPVMRVFVPR